MTSARQPVSNPSAAQPAQQSHDGDASCGGWGTSRRSFLERGAVLGAAGLATAGLAGCTDDLRRESTAPSHHVGGSPTPVIPADELPVGSSASVRFEGRTLLLRREDETTVHAFSAVCTHQGCTVAPGVDAGQDTFACPCHGSHFDVNTGVPYGGPARKPLTAFTAAVEGDWVLVTL